MAPAPNVGFSCIRYVASEKALTLEMYRDVPDIGRSVTILLQRCDITFDDRNIFNCSWESERYTLVSDQVTADNLDFLHHLLKGEMELITGQWLHIFTVSTIIFALVVAFSESNTTEFEKANNCEYGIHQLCAYATNIDCIQLDCEERRCLIFLQCGSIDILYYSQ
ncbi:uncharacterized protein [Eurosta solidaginis]|uniref:uncharacterized protein n=1 Tax=Eurosta solidaginis TaxID=178769 RepID=UPI003530BDFF